MSFHYVYTIHGRIVSKKNSHRARWRGNMVYVGNSDTYLNWERDATTELRYQRGRVPTIPKGQLVGISMTIYLAKRQRAFDEDNAMGGVYDALQGAGVVENDRQLRLVRLEQLRDSTDPRVEIELTPWVGNHLTPDYDLGKVWSSVLIEF
jgi:Holliday junction resolvase RusA-like endonuclease